MATTRTTLDLIVVTASPLVQKDLKASRNDKLEHAQKEVNKLLRKRLAVLFPGSPSSQPATGCPVAWPCLHPASEMGYTVLIELFAPHPGTNGLDAAIKAVVEKAFSEVTSKESYIVIPRLVPPSDGFMPRRR